MYQTKILQLLVYIHCFNSLSILEFNWKLTMTKQYS